MALAEGLDNASRMHTYRLAVDSDGNVAIFRDGTPLISYIAPSAPATRCPATGGEAFLRPELGFTPAWYRCALGIDFGERWHNDVDYRRETVVAMRAELRRRFPGSAVGGTGRPDAPLDLLTGVYGGKAVPALFGLPIVYAADNWPDVQHRYLRKYLAGCLSWKMRARV